MDSCHLFSGRINTKLLLCVFRFLSYLKRLFLTYNQTTFGRLALFSRKRKICTNNFHSCVLVNTSEPTEQISNNFSTFYNYLVTYHIIQSLPSSSSDLVVITCHSHTSEPIPLRFLIRFFKFYTNFQIIHVSTLNFPGVSSRCNGWSDGLQNRCEFELQSRYNVHFRTNTLRKGKNPLILPAMG